MIHIKNLLIIPAFIALVALGIWGTGKVVAADSGNTLSIVTRIAQRFGLNEADVQTFFDELHQEKMTEHASRLEERLTQAVTDGKITEQQKQDILTKFKELQEKHAADRDAFGDMTSEERREAMEKHRRELEAWAQEKGIDLQNLFGFGFGMKMHGFGHGFGMKLK